MSQRKIRNRNPSPQNPDKPTADGIFKQAESYFQAAHVLFMHATQLIGFQPQLIFPSTVCEAFSLELFLKCLMLVEGTQYKPGHDLEKLFDHLSVDSKAHIRAHCERGLAQIQQMMNMAHQQYQQTGKGMAEPPPRIDFEYALASSRRAFEAYRYVHEGKSAMEPGGNWLGKPILHSVRDRILILRPEWKNISFTAPASPPATPAVASSSSTPSAA